MCDRVKKMCGLIVFGSCRNRNKVLINQLKASQFEEETVLTWALKAGAMALLVALNCYFIFSCMLYGQSKGTIRSVTRYS